MIIFYSCFVFSQLEAVRCPGIVSRFSDKQLVMCLPHFLDPLEFSNPYTGPRMLFPSDSAQNNTLFPLTCSLPESGYFMWTFTSFWCQTNVCQLVNLSIIVLDNYNMHEKLWPIFIAFLNGTPLFLTQLHIGAYTIVNPTSNITL